MSPLTRSAQMMPPGMGGSPMPPSAPPQGPPGMGGGTDPGMSALLMALLPELLEMASATNPGLADEKEVMPPGMGMPGMGGGQDQMGALLAMLAGGGGGRGGPAMPPGY